MATRTAKLTGKQAAFVDFYVQSFNATQAAIAAGYAEDSAHVTGHNNINNPKIQAEIAERLKERQMSADEALSRLADIARGDLSQALDTDHNYTRVDIDALKRAGLGHLIKSFRQTKAGINIEFHDPLRALDMIMKATGQYIDRTDITSGGEPIQQITRIEIVPNKREDNAA